jgi:uncharacterized membrane protein YeaQ/YmgE (transglycosylase-associated protein family)
MNIITLLVVGVVIGWIASVLMGTDGREGLIRNVAIGIAGAYVGSFLLDKLSESASQGGFSFGAMVASVLGAATLLLVVSRFARA